MKTKLIFGAVVLVLIGFVWVLFHFNAKLKEDRDRLSYNLTNSEFRIDSISNKNGELQYSVNALELKDKELKVLNADLDNKLKDMGLKVKNLENATNIEYKYIYVTDSMNVNKLNDTTFFAKNSDKYIDLSERVTLIENGKNIKIDSVNIVLKDSLITAQEIKWKGWWFWKRPVSMTLHIKSNNPYFKLDKVETYNFIKNSGKKKR